MLTGLATHGGQRLQTRVGGFRLARGNVASRRKAGGPSSSQHNRILGLEMSGPNPTSSAPADAPRFMHMTAAAAGTKAAKGIPIAEQLGGLWASTTVLTSVEDDLMQVIEPAADLGRGVLADLQGQHTPEPRVRGVFESEDTVVLSAPKQDMKDQVIKTIGGGQAQTIIACRVNVRQAEGKVGAPKRPRVTEAEGS